MAKRLVPAQELAAVASRFNGTPVDNNPRAFKFPDAAASDAWNKSVDRLEAGETLDVVLGNKPSRSTTGAAPLDAAVGFIGGLMHQVLDPAVDASRALLPGGWGVEAAAERLAGDKQALTNSDIYKKATYIPETKAGTLGSYLPVLAGTALGVATEGAIPTLATLGGAVGAQKASEATAGYIAGQPTFNLTPEQIESWRRLAGTAGMVAGGAAAHKMTPKATIPEAVENVKQSRQALADSAKQRAAGAIVIGKQGFESAGYPGLVAGTIAGAVKPELVDLTKQRLVDIARGETEATPAPKPATSPRGPKPTPTAVEQRNALINAGAQAATEAKNLEQLTPAEAASYKKTLERARDAHIANGNDVPSLIAEQLTRASQELAKPRLQKTAAAVQETLDAYGPNGLAGRVELVPDAVAKRDYISTQKSLNAYVEAGEQPPTGLVELFDRLRERVVATNKAVSAEAYDSATAALVDAAAQGPQAYAKALQSLPKQTRALLQNVDAELLNTLQSRAKNAGGTLGAPADDPWFALMNDVLGEWARPASVEVPVESPGGSATVPSGVDVVRVPGAAVSVPAQAPAPASASATTPATASAPTQATAPATANSASARAARRGGSVLGYSTELPRQHNAQTLSAAARMLQLAHDITAAREANPRAFTKGTAQYAMKDSALDASLAEFERLARLFAGRGKLSSFASTRENIPNVGTVNGWIANATELTPRMKRLLGVETPKKD